MNGVDLKLFRFDGDLTWMSFFMDARDQFYARYGGRGDADAESYLSKQSLARVMQQVLLLHKTGKSTPVNKSLVAAYATAEAIPPMKKMLAPRKEKCIHCHDVKNATLRQMQREGRFQKDLVFSYPDPIQVGIQLDPGRQDHVTTVSRNSPASRAGVQSGDRILTVGGQRVLTMADFSQVLEGLPARTNLPVQLQRRPTEIVETTLRLTGDWKKRGDPWWRPSTDVAGPNAGFWAVELTAPQKRTAGMQPDALGLKVTFLFPGHPTPRQSDVRLGDVLVQLDGKQEKMNTRQMHAYLQMNYNYGDRVPIKVLRKGKEKSLVLQLRSKRPSLD